MARIVRDPGGAVHADYDLIIIGGGIYGAMLSLESSMLGLKSLLLERDDLGEHTSYNSLRIIHGGLRYLQTLDLHRFRESVQERRWFLKTFPGLVKPLPCLMPLYGCGLKRPSIFKWALLINNFLSRKRNEDVPLEQHLGDGGVIPAKKILQLFPEVDQKGLLGGAVWYDACMPDSQRILMQIFLWACDAGATLLNYTEAITLMTEGNKVTGVRARDQETGDEYQYKAAVVINAAGPWCRKIATMFHRDEPSLFRPSLAFNVLLDRAALSSHALAVAPKKPGSRTYFLVPWKGRIMAGTGHEQRKTVSRYPKPTDEYLQAFISDLNMAIPDFNLTEKDIIHIYAGLLPVTEEGGTTLSVREVIFDHSQDGGPEGLYTVSGVKFTTSKLVARKTLQLIFPNLNNLINENTNFYYSNDNIERKESVFDSTWLPKDEDVEWKRQLTTLINNESVLHLDDLLIRRTSLADNLDRVENILPALSSLFNWEETRWQKEQERFDTKLTRNIKNRDVR